MGSIQVGFKSILIPGTNIPTRFSHSYAVYNDDKGESSFTRAGPLSNILGAEGLASGAPQYNVSSTYAFGAGFGSIAGISGTYQPKTVDYPTLNDPRTFITVATGPDSELGPRFDTIRNEINTLAGQDIPYGVNDVNSNSALGTALRGANIALPNLDNYGIEAPGCRA